MTMCNDDIGNDVCENGQVMTIVCGGVLCVTNWRLAAASVTVVMTAMILWRESPIVVMPILCGVIVVMCDNDVLY